MILSNLGLLNKRRILVGVSGSIAIYKSLDLIRLLIKAGAQVRVVMSESAKKFVTPLTFEAVSGFAVLNADSENWHSELNHIGLAKWAELFIIAPASANTLNKLSNAIADNLLLQTALAYDGIRLVAPSANTAMLNNPITQASLKMLKLSDHILIDTQNKMLACNTQGDGAMAEPQEIVFQAARILLSDPFWQNRRAVVSGGGTIEKIDEVRYISNFSSGKMASALATALYLRGADVCFVSSRYPDPLPQEMCTYEIESSKEMFEVLSDSLKTARIPIRAKPSLMYEAQLEPIVKEPYLFMSAAVSDYIPTQVDGKLKKDDVGQTMNLELKQNIDILSSLNRQGIKTIGFKAEMNETNALENAQIMLDKKSLDGVCLNVLKNSDSFGTDESEFKFISSNGIKEIVKSHKLHLAFEILKNASTG